MIVFDIFAVFLCFKIKSALCFYGKERKLVKMLEKKTKITGRNPG